MIIRLLTFQNNRQASHFMQPGAKVRSTSAFAGHAASYFTQGQSCGYRRGPCLEEKSAGCWSLLTIRVVERPARVCISSIKSSLMADVAQ